MELNAMNKKLMAAAVMCSLMSATAFAANPIPTFDKEAVTTHPCNRTGQQEQQVTGMQGAGELYKPGNTGTEANPAFFVAKVKLTGFTLPDKSGKLAAICKEYEGRSLQMAELQQLISRINEYARTCGYTVAQAIVPPQEVKQGELEITVYVASTMILRLSAMNRT
jgi:hemolysin activation/secretion protein